MRFPGGSAGSRSGRGETLNGRMQSVTAVPLGGPLIICEYIEEGREKESMSHVHKFKRKKEKEVEATVAYREKVKCKLFPHEYLWCHSVFCPRTNNPVTQTTETQT